MVALSPTTTHRQTLFVKNSDRPADKCQPPALHPRIDSPKESDTRCQFVTLRDAGVTNSHVGSRLWWCWGYEHGFNEYRVVIGNAAFHSKIERADEGKLLGVELVRGQWDRPCNSTSALTMPMPLPKRAIA